MVVWCSIMLFCIFFEIIDWVLHFDSHGKLKYAYYETFLYGNGDDKTEAEKKELIELMHQISGITFTKVMRKLLKDDKINSNEKDRALAAVSAVVSDFIGVCYRIYRTTFSMKLGARSYSLQNASISNT